MIMPLVSNAITLETSQIEARQYVPYPISSKNIFSLIGSDTKNLSYLLKKVASKAVPTPMRTESAQFLKKLPNNSKITVPVSMVSPVELTIESTDYF